MSKALSGSHYCATHQGNHSHYAEENCELCTAKREIVALRAKVETERMRLVACGVVAMANTSESAAKAREMSPEYRSASLREVERAVDSEMALRAEVEKLRGELVAMLQGDGLEHMYEGDCPSYKNTNSRDPQCHACGRLDQLVATEAK